MMNVEKPPITLAAAIDSINILRSFCNQWGIDSLQIDELEQIIGQQRATFQQQTKITDFFS